MVPIDQRAARVTPDRRLSFQFFLPGDFARMDLDAIEMAFRPQGIDPIAIDGRRGARAAGVGDGIRAVVLHLPEEVPIRIVKTENALDARQAAPREGILRCLDPFLEEMIGDDDPPRRNRRLRIPRPHAGPPKNSRPALGPGSKNTLLPINPIPTRPKPLRIFITPDRQPAKGKKEHKTVSHGRY